MSNGFASLGYNCEAAFQFRRILGHDVSSYFNWTYNKPQSVIKLIRNDFADMLLPDRIAPTGIMIWESGYDISYHGDIFNKSDNGKDKASFDLHYNDLAGKMAFLRQKWLDTTASNDHTTYYLKLKEESGAPRPRTQAVRVRDALREAYPDHSFLIVAIMSLEQSQREPDWVEPQIINRYLSAFAPDSSPQDGNVEEWDQIFEEFPIVESVRG
ncbi:MAG: DUF1796 family putative cysteine peptidase [Sphingobium sp.]